jgi:hypothetical protein
MADLDGTKITDVVICARAHNTITWGMYPVQIGLKSMEARGKKL